VHHPRMRTSLVGLVLVVVGAAACTSASEPSTTAAPASTMDTEAAISTSLPAPTSGPSSTTSSSLPTLTRNPRPDPIYYTFESTLECDPDSDQAALQEVQAFFTAYNERNLDRLQQLVSPDLDEIWDPSALPHTGQVLSTDVTSWAQAGWEIDDSFELRRLVDYGQQSGSDIILIRRNQGTGTLGIDGLVVGFKAPASGCTIGRLVGHIDQGAITNCPFFDLYEDQLRQQLSSGWELPPVCTS
jgi:hypothetical protein